MKFKNIYFFEVISKIENGETVYVLDRLIKTINCINEMKVDDVVSILNESRGNQNNRFDFWIEEITEEEAE